MRMYKINLIGISEVKKKGTRMIMLNSNYTVWSECGKAWHMVATEMYNMVSGSQGVNSWIITADLDLEIHVTSIQVYAPTEDSDVQSKEELYNELSRIEKVYNEGRQIMIGGDLNNRIWQAYEWLQELWVHFEFCVDNGLLVGNILFQCKKIYHIAFETKGKTANSIIDYLHYNKEITGRQTEFKSN